LKFKISKSGVTPNFQLNFILENFIFIRNDYKHRNNTPASDVDGKIMFVYLIKAAALKDPQTNSHEELIGQRE